MFAFHENSIKDGNFPMLYIFDKGNQKPKTQIVRQ